MKYKITITILLAMLSIICILKVLVAYNFNISFIGASTNIPVDGIFIAFTIAGIWATWNCDINSRDKGGK